MLEYDDYKSMFFFAIILIIYIAVVIHTIRRKKQPNKVEFKIRKLEVLDFLVISLNIAWSVKGLCYVKNVKISTIVVAMIGLFVGFITTFVLNKVLKEEINESVNGINIEEMKEHIYIILQKYNLDYKEINFDSDWLKDIRIEYESKEAKIELHRNGESSTLIFIRSLNILPCRDFIISDLKNAISTNEKEFRWRDNLRSLILVTIIAGYFLLAIGSTFFHKII